MSEFAHWHKSVDDVLKVTERNLRGVDFEDEMHHPNRFNAIGTSIGSGARRNEGYSRFGLLETRPLVRSGALHPPANDTGRGGVYVETSLAYRLDSISLSLSTLQKDFEQYRAANSAQGSRVAECAAEAKDSAEDLKAEWSRYEKRINAKLARVQTLAEEAENSIYNRVPGMGLASPPHEGGGGEQQSARIDQLTTRVKLLEESLARSENAGQQQRLEKIVEEEVEAKTELITRECLSAARKAAGHEIRCKFDFVQNELNETVLRITADTAADVQKQLSAFRSEQVVAAEKKASLTTSAVSNVKHDLESLSHWKDIVTTRLDDLDAEMTKRMAQSSDKQQQAAKDMLRSVEVQVAAAVEKINRQIEKELVGLVPTDQLDSQIGNLKSSVEASLRAVRSQLSQSFEDRLVSSTADLHKKVSDAGFAAKSLQATMIEEIASAAQGVELRVRSEEEKQRRGLSDSVRQLSSDLVEHRKRSHTLEQKLEDLEVTAVALSSATRDSSDKSAAEPTGASVLSPELSSQPTSFVTNRRFMNEVEATADKLDKLKRWVEHKVSHAPVAVIRETVGAEVEKVRAALSKEIEELRPAVLAELRSHDWNEAKGSHPQPPQSSGKPPLQQASKSASASDQEMESDGAHMERVLRTLADDFRNLAGATPTTIADKSMTFRGATSAVSHTPSIPRPSQQPITVTTAPRIDSDEGTTPRTRQREATRQLIHKFKEIDSTCRIGISLPASPSESTMHPDSQSSPSPLAAQHPSRHDALKSRIVSLAAESSSDDEDDISTARGTVPVTVPTTDLMDSESDDSDAAFEYHASRNVAFTDFSSTNT